MMSYSFTIQPETYYAFGNEAEQIEKCKEWGLLSEKASKTKTFHYKGNGVNLACNIVGYVDKMTAIIQFENGNRHCIHPSYLKEMQASGYGQKGSAEAEELSVPAGEDPETPSVETPPEKNQNAESPKTAAQPKVPAKKEKEQKLQLPDEKVKMTATVKEFATVPNNFSDTDDEVIIYEAVAIAEPETEVGAAWSSHSATLKKLELQIGDTILFEGKIIRKKLTKHPVPYKINNPAKIQKVVG